MISQHASLNRAFAQNRRLGVLFIFVCILFVMLFFTGCDRSEVLLTFSVSETAGIARSHEFIEIEIPADRINDPSDGICIREQGTTQLIRGQLLDSVPHTAGDPAYTFLFPVSVDKGETRSFEVVPGDGPFHEEQLKITGNGLNLLVENSYFVADLTDRKATEQNGLGPGQISGIVLRQFRDHLLERTHLNMHWAPNFQKEGLDYRTFGHIREDERVSIQRGPYLTTIRRSGRVDDYREIRVDYEYRFYAGIPYFIFSSEILMEKDVELILLRNDEMTMDSLFTHVQFLPPGGTVNCVGLYDGQGVEELEKDPVPHDAEWLSFFHEELEYGFGTIRLEYDNRDLQGQPSPLFEPHTKISKSAGNGRYWNRRLIHEHLTLVPQGSRYHEKNAYLVFRASRDNPSGEISAFHRQLTTPLQVRY